MEGDKSEINLVLTRLFQIKENSKQESFKETLIEEFKIDTRLVATVWKKDDYDTHFENSWLNFFYAKILEASDQDLWINFDFLKSIINILTEYEAKDRDDMIKFVLYFIVDNIFAYDKFQIDFFKWKINKSKNKFIGSDSHEFSFRNNMATAFQMIIVDCCGNVGKFQKFIPQKYHEGLRKLLGEIYPDLTYLALVLPGKDENIITLEIDKFKEILLYSYKELTAFIEKLNTEVDVELWKFDIDAQMKSYTKSYQQVVESINTIEKFIKVDDFEMDKAQFFPDQESFEDYLKMTYSKGRYYKHSNLFNECELLIPKLIEDLSFRKLFQDICKTKVIRSFYKHELDNYYKERKLELQDYYMLIKDFNFFWARVKPIHLPDTIVGVTTDMLVIYINSIQKRFKNIANEKDKETVNIYLL
jgi:hypothetical protein